MLLVPHHFSNPENLGESHPRSLLTQPESRRCINPCAEGRPCAPSALCKVVNHRAICTCPDGYIGSPTTDCRKRECNNLVVKDRSRGGSTGLGPEMQLICNLQAEIDRSGFFPLLQVQKHLQDSGAPVQARPPVQAEPPVGAGAPV